MSGDPSKDDLSAVLYELEYGDFFPDYIAGLPKPRSGLRGVVKPLLAAVAVVALAVLLGRPAPAPSWPRSRPVSVRIGIRPEPFR